MNKQQIALIIGSLAMVALLYFGFDTKPPKQRLIEKSRAGDVELRETQNAIRLAKTQLPEDLRSYIQGLENVVDGATEDSVKSEALRTLSAVWYDQGAFVPAGYYAEVLAQTAGTADSWDIAGSTYSMGFSDQAVPGQRRLAAAGAIRCFENAISLDPENIDYRVNLAVCYAEAPPEESPMKGIQMLLELNRNNPDNISVLYQLARFGMRTGQYDKARERLEKAISLDSSQQRLYCLMAELLKATQQSAEAEHYLSVCNGNGK